MYIFFLGGGVIFCLFFIFFCLYSEFFLVVLTPADLWYHSWFPRYRHLAVFVTDVHGRAGRAEIEYSSTWIEMAPHRHNVTRYHSYPLITFFHYYHFWAIWNNVRLNLRKSQKIWVWEMLAPLKTKAWQGAWGKPISKVHFFSAMLIFLVEIPLPFHSFCCICLFVVWVIFKRELPWFFNVWAKKVQIVTTTLFMIYPILSGCGKLLLVGAMKNIKSAQSLALPRSFWRLLGPRCGLSSSERLAQNWPINTQKSPISDWLVVTCVTLHFIRPIKTLGVLYIGSEVSKRILTFSLWSTFSFSTWRYLADLSKDHSGGKCLCLLYLYVDIASRNQNANKLIN